MYALSPVLKNYDWGSLSDIPALLGIQPTGEPVAEAWWGAHPTFSSTADVAGQQVPLTTVLESNAVELLGPDVANVWGGALPYLVKVLGVARPLSIQVHPSKAQAARGFDNEVRTGVPTDSPARSFRDRSDKPELVVALSPMVVLAGFRPVGELVADLHHVAHPVAQSLIETLHSAQDPARSIERYMRRTLSLPRGAEVLDALVDAAGDARVSLSHRVAAQALEHHPGDTGALVALALNAQELSPGQAIYSGAGVVHSYQSGMGLEVMANSDNVVRGGLTSKPVDVDLLCELAITTPGAAPVVEPNRTAGLTSFDTPAQEFALTLVERATAEFRAGPQIVLSLNGSSSVRTAAERRDVPQGSAVFIGHGDGPFSVTAGGRVAVIGSGRSAG
jgi:mannose-6-phosphate isomerase